MIYCRKRPTVECGERGGETEETEGGTARKAGKDYLQIQPNLVTKFIKSGHSLYIGRDSRNERRSKEHRSGQSELGISNDDPGIPGINRVQPSLGFGSHTRPSGKKSY